jgi:hypothetical protein
MPKDILQVGPLQWGWISTDKAKAWNESASQKDSRKIGDKFATFREFIVEGIEAN